MDDSYSEKTTLDTGKDESAEKNEPKDREAFDEAIASKNCEDKCTSPILDTESVRRRGQLRFSRKSLGRPIVEETLSYSRANDNHVGSCLSDEAREEPSDREGRSKDLLRSLIETKRRRTVGPNTARRATIARDNEISAGVQEFANGLEILERACRSDKFWAAPSKPPRSTGLRSFKSVEKMLITDAESSVGSSPDITKAEDAFEERKEDAPSGRRLTGRSEKPKEDQFVGFSSAEMRADCEIKKTSGSLSPTRGARKNHNESLGKREITRVRRADSFGIYGTKAGPPELRDEDVLGFRTARGGDLKISSEALSRARALFGEITECESSDRYPGIPPPETILKSPKEEVEERKIMGSSGGCGFTTASGRGIKISNEALSKAKAAFVDIEKKDADASCRQSVDGGSVEAVIETKREKNTRGDKSSESLVVGEFDEENTNISSFRTARGGRVKISMEALSKARLVFSDLENEYIEDSDSANRPRSEPAPAIDSRSYETTELEDFSLIDAAEATNKRKSYETNEDTPERKRGRYASNLHGRQLFAGDLKNEAAAAVTGDTKYSSEANGKPAPGGSSKSPGGNVDVERDKKMDTRSESSIPDDLNFDSQFSEESQQSRVIEKFITETIESMEARLAMSAKQEEAIRAKRGERRVTAIDGSLYRLRTLNDVSRYSWQRLTEGKPPVPRVFSRKSIDSAALSITARSAASYTFSCADFYGGKNIGTNVRGIEVGDGAFLILDERNRAGPKEFERAFLASPGVDPNLVPAGWLGNHYRWIVWKLASMDRVTFGHKCLPRMLTPHRVMLELRYRYDREIHRSQWPALRRILEKNQSAGARLVLCVADVIDESEDTRAAKGVLGSSVRHKIELTDGWYSIFASIDLCIENLIKRHRIKEGTKLVTFGARPLNLDQGCSVLEIPEAVTLRIHGNSTRRARWDTKLGFYRSNPGPMCLDLKSVESNGGAICKLVVAVARSYPILYREKLADGQYVYRNARCDDEAARAHEVRCQAKMEEICDKVRADFQKGFSGENHEEEIRERIGSKLQEFLPPARDVTPVLKIRIAQGDTSAMMTIWSTDRENEAIFEEGSSIVVYNSFASGQRCNELQITAGRNTVFNGQVSRRIVHPERIFSPLMEIGEPTFNPVYGEFDTVGVVSSIGAAPHGMKNFETVNLACPRGDDRETSDFLSVLFWQGVSSHGCSKILTVGTMVACNNLERRRNTSRSIPTAYCTERSVFTKNPRQIHLAEPFENMRELIKDLPAYAAKCASAIEERVAKKTRPGNGGTPSLTPSANNPRSALDSRRASDSIDLGPSTTPKNSCKKASTMRRIEKLESYGEPPKLPPLAIHHNSPKVSARYRSPVGRDGPR